MVYHLIFDMYFISLFSADFDKVVCEYLSLTPEKVVDTDAPVMFISFPSAKDPKAWAQKYPGRITFLAQQTSEI